MARYTLYGFNASTYVRTVRMLLHEKGIEYDQVPVDILHGEGRSEEHLKRHPFGKIPAFESNGVSLFETSAITELIEGENTGEPRFIPQDTIERARMRQWMDCIDDYTYPQVVGTLVWQRVVNPALEVPTDEDVVSEAMPDVRRHFGLFDRALGENPYLAGASLTLADLYLAPIMAYVSMTPEGEQLLGEHANVGRWWKEIQQRQSFIDTPPM